MWPLSSDFPTRKIEELCSEYDYIIAGGGTAGCVLARRLAEAGKFTVLLVERGDAGDSFFHRTPLLSFNHFSDGKHSSIFDSTHNPQLSRPYKVLTGVGMGGATRINGAQYTSGVPGQLNHWNNIVGGGWSFAEMRPYLNRFENFVGAEAREYHGKDGPVTIRSFDDYFYGSSSRTFDAARRAGFEVIDDLRSPLAPPTGVNKMHFTINQDGTRASSFRAYLPEDFCHQVSDRLHICTETLVRKIVLSVPEDGRLEATGVEIEPVLRGRLRVVSARREVILTAGALHTPKILLLSGLGPKEHLKDMDLPILKDLPGVGNHLQDHLILPVSFYCPLEDSMWCMIRWPPTLIKQLYRYLRYGDGWFLGTFVEVEIFASSKAIDKDGTPKPLSANLDPSDPENIPDVCVMGCPISDPTRPGSNKSRGFCGLHVALLSPKSTGNLTLSSPDPHTPPRCEFNSLSALEDWENLRVALKISMRIADEMRKDGYALDDYDVPKSLENADLDDFIRGRVDTMYHYSSTCRMAKKSDGGVVDRNLRVYGTTNLRICDASVFPDSPGTHPQALVYAFAERCAEMVLAEADSDS